MSLFDSFLLLITLAVFSCGIIPVANAIYVTRNPKGKGTDAVNSKENAENKCPEKQNCWAEYEGKWKTQLIGRNVNSKVGGQNAIYNGTDGTCGIWDGKKYDDFKGTKYDQIHIKTMEDFMNHAFMPACGNPYHEFMADCAKKYFYGGKKIAESEVMTTEDKFKKVHQLALLEACFICAEGDGKNKPPVPSEISVEVTYRWPVGSFFSNCDEERQAALEKTKLPIGKDGRNSFTFVMLFVPRECHAVFTTDAPQTKYDQIKMKVDYICGGTQKSLTVNLPDLEPTKFEGNFAEMRYVQFNLEKGASGVMKLKWEKMVLSDAKFEWEKKPKNA